METTEITGLQMTCPPEFKKLMRIIERELTDDEKKVLTRMLDLLDKSAQRAIESIDQMLAFEDASNQRIAQMEAWRIKEAPWAL